MEYEIHIIDVDNPDDVLIEHYAERDSINISWLGGDDPTQPIVPSVCRFTLETGDGEDGKYIQYFTSREKKYKVKFVIHETQQVLGQWYLLPETYQEPYLNPLFYTSFEAVDGLGLLKGQTLPDDFYKKEKSVIEIISECLQLTEVDFDIYFAPAIQNRVNTNWKDIFINTEFYFDEDKPPSAYTFLEELMFSMRCQLFQCEGRWYIEGVNRRHIPKVKFYKYDILGNYLGTVDISKNIKETSHFLDADIFMLPALGKVIVSHEAPELKVSDELVHEEVEWITFSGVNGKFFPRHWNFTENFQPKIHPPDHYLRLPAHDVASQTGAYNAVNKINLRDKPYIQRNTRVRIKMSFEAGHYSTLINTTTQVEYQENYNNGYFIDPLIYRILLNGDVLFENINTGEFDQTRISLDAQGKGELQLDFIAQENGLLDIELTEPKKIPTVDFIAVKTLSVENLQQKDSVVVTKEVDADSSVVTEIDLPISDDISALSKTFQLEKIKELDQAKEVVVTVPILYKQVIDGKNYSIVGLEGAVLIEQFPDSLYWYGLNIKVSPPRVIYNLNGGNEMAIETGSSSYGTGNFYVKVKPYKDPVTDRLDWQKWTDAIYEIENKTYADVVAEIEKRMFLVPKVSIHGTIDFPLKYNDLLKFTYRGQERYFSFSNIEWASDGNETTFIANEAMYEGSGTGNIPPLVYAGDDIYSNLEGTVNLRIRDAAVNSPFGEIESLLWEQVSGDGTVTFVDNSALVPTIYNLTGDEYTFRLTATDTKGQSASDEVKWYRLGSHAITFDLVSTNVYVDGGIQYSNKKFKVVVTPELPEGISVLLKMTAGILVEGEPLSNGIGVVEVNKNGSKAFDLHPDTFLFVYDQPEYSVSGAVSYTAGDEIIIALVSGLGSNSSLEVTQRVEMTEASFGDNKTRTATGIPVEASQVHTR